MGIYIYTVRTKNVTAKIEGTEQTIYALGFLSRSDVDYRGCEHYVAARGIGAAQATWDRRGETPKFVFLAGGPKDNKPEDGAPVYEWDGRAADYDTPNFEGAKRTVGFLKSTKVGRKTVWTVEPALFSVSIGTYGTMGNIGRCFHVKVSKTFFSAAEAVHYAQALMIESESACFEVNRAQPKTALERVAAPTSVQVEAVVDTLLVGPNRLQTAAERQTADALAAEGHVTLYRCPEGHVWYELTTRGLIEAGGLERVRGLRVELTHDRVVFQGSKTGAHSLARGPFTPLARVRSHWEGYCKIAASKAEAV